MAFPDFFVPLTTQPWAQAISGSKWFGFFEWLHVLGVAVLLGSIGLMDLRLLGLAGSGRRATLLSREALPWTWGGFVLVIVSGFLIFAGAADRYVVNAAFQFKMLLLALAGANMLIFQVFIWRGVDGWDTASPSAAARLAGGLSLFLWIAVVVAGRAIAFVH
jgi:hypothetical protein